MCRWLRHNLIAGVLGVKHARIQKGLPEGDKLLQVFFFIFFLLFCCCFVVDEGKKDPNTTISGSSSAHQAGVPMLVQH